MSRGRSEKCQFHFAKHQIYEVFDVLVEHSGCKRGKIRLFNVITEELESYSVWEDNMVNTNLFVFLPTGENGKLEKYDLEETFSINPVIFTEIREFL